MIRISKLLLVLFFVLLSLGLSSCVQEIIWPTETRIQLVNNSQGSVRNLSIEALVDGTDNIVLVPETLAAGERSRVYTHELSGNFTLKIEREVDCLEGPCYAMLQFRDFVLDGGSIVLKYKDGPDGPILKQD